MHGASGYLWLGPETMTEAKDSSPLLTLWYKPGRTLQGLIQSGGGGRAALVIVALFGLLQSFAVLRAGAQGSILLIGPLLAIAFLFLFGWLMRNFGRWFGAEARLKDLRLALGWGLLPWLLVFAVLAWLSEQVVNPSALARIYPYFFGLFLYGYVILLVCLKSALGLSFLKTFLCLIVVILVSLFPFTLAIQLVLGPPPAL